MILLEGAYPLRLRSRGRWCPYCWHAALWHWLIYKKIDLSFIWGHHHLLVVGMEDQSINWLLHYLLHRADEAQLTRSKQMSTVAIVGFQFGLNHVVVSLSFVLSITLASLFSSLIICVAYTFRSHSVLMGRSLNPKLITRSLLASEIPRRLLENDQSVYTNCAQGSYNQPHRWPISFKDQRLKTVHKAFYFSADRTGFANVGLC